MLPASRRPDLLICALSGRALAQSARRAGLQPAVLDAFCDTDTQAAAVCARVPLAPDWRFDPAALRQLADQLAPPPVPLVYGSGFERDPALLAALACGRPLLGTPPEGLVRLTDPEAFAAACARLGIAHPETRTLPPADAAGWLVKRRGGAGGGHVRPAQEFAPSDLGDWYFQRRLDGVPISLVFLADGHDVLPLTTTRQWTAPGRGFRFSGVSLPEPLPTAAYASLVAAARGLASWAGVRGFASLDALLAGGRAVVLELNPRPTASLEPLELATGRNLVELHLAAAAGSLPPAAPPLLRAAASEIVFAPEDLVMPVDFTWPGWAGDRTPAGTRVPRHGPVATVVATGPDAATARAAACQRRDALTDRLFQTAGWQRIGVSA